MSTSGGVLSCEWGGDALGRNTTFGSCSATVYDLSVPLWQVFQHPTPTNPSACAATYADAHNGSCSADVNLACDYDEGRCACVCKGTTVAWQCRDRSPILDSSFNLPCPQPRAQAGTACSMTNEYCKYDMVCGSEPLSFGPAFLCNENGWWELAPDTAAACAPSNCPGWTGGIP